MKAFSKKIQNLRCRKYYPLGKLLLMALLVILFLDKCTYMVMPPWKETDPSKPGFKAENFEYEDYIFDERRFEKNLVPVFKVMFPVGTSKEYVDEILVYKNGADVSYSAHYDYHAYTYRSHKTFYMPLDYFLSFAAATFYYDGDNELRDIKINGVFVHGEE